MHPWEQSIGASFSKEHHEAILNHMTEGILTLTPEGEIVYANPAAVSIIGVSGEQLTGSSFFEHFSGTDREKIRKRFDNAIDGRASMCETFRISHNGKYILLTLFFLDHQEDKKGIVILNDVSRQQRMEAERQRADRMEAIGTLAGGVAHDLNNILSGLVSYPELLLFQIPEDDPLRKPIETIQQAGERAAEVVQDLLALARRGVVVQGVVNLNDLVSDYLKSPEYEKLRLQHEDVRLETRLATDLFNISGSSRSLSKTVINLVSNAAEANPAGGKIILSTENRYIDRPIRGYTDINEGDYVVLNVVDGGTGISTEHMEKIFEPFYTKKKMGRRGTGLGMALVWGTVKDHNGYIDVQSAEGVGTTFTLYFPVTREDSTEDFSTPAMDYCRGNGETVLIVDDMEAQRKIASDMLTQLGYSTVSVSSGEEALKYLKTHTVDLLVLDMIMDPGMDGLDTYRKILELHPGQKAVIASGFSETDRVKKAQDLGAGAYIKKPFLLKRIGLAVKQELAG